MAKEGSTIGGLMDAFGTAVSMSLQYGVPLEDLRAQVQPHAVRAAGHTKNPDIRIAKSLIDYIFRWLGITFLSNDAQYHAGVNNREERRDEPRVEVQSSEASVAQGAQHHRGHSLLRLSLNKNHPQPLMRPQRSRTRKTRRRAACADRSWCGAAA